MIWENKNANWIEVTVVFRTEMTNINAGEPSGGNEIELKKIHLEDGTIVPRISAQALMRMIRDYWAEEKKLDVAITRKGINQDDLPSDTTKYIDYSLFGYMLPKKGEGKSETTRSGRIRSIGARGIFEYPDDRDFITSFVSTTGKAGKGGSMASKEIATNTYIAPFWIDLPRIEKRELLQSFFEALFYLKPYDSGNYKEPLNPICMVVGTFRKRNISLWKELMQGISVKIKDIKLQKEPTRTGEERIISIATGKVSLDIDFTAIEEKIKLYADDVLEIKVGVMESLIDGKIVGTRMVSAGEKTVKIDVVPLSDLRKQIC